LPVLGRTFVSIEKLMATVKVGAEGYSQFKRFVFVTISKISLLEDNKLGFQVLCPVWWIPHH
jgi:hypothetical protein